MANDGTEPGERYWRAIEPIWDSVSIYDGPAVFLEQFSQLPPHVGHLFAAHWCQSEVRNGGFHQFFSNSTGVLAPEAVAGFKAIGLPGCAHAIEEAMTFFGAPYPRDRDVRNAVLDRFAEAAKDDVWDPFVAIDDRFFDLLEAEGGGFERAADTYAERFCG